MKLSTVIVRDKHTAISKSLFTAKQGDDMRFEAGLVTIVSGGRTFITPVSNVTWMEPAEEPAKKGK